MYRTNRTFHFISVIRIVYKHAYVEYIQHQMGLVAHVHKLEYNSTDTPQIQLTIDFTKINNRSVNSSIQENSTKKYLKFS